MDSFGFYERNDHLQCGEGAAENSTSSLKRREQRWMNERGVKQGGAQEGKEGKKLAHSCSREKRQVPGDPGPGSWQLPEVIKENS